MHPSTVQLFIAMATFGAITVGVYLACMWMVKIEERKVAKRRGQRRV
jgi:hypothetical protein